VTHRTGITMQRTEKQHSELYGEASFQVIPFRVASKSTCFAEDDCDGDPMGEPEKEPDDVSA
jgi:hypothetical protein